MSELETSAARLIAALQLPAAYAHQVANIELFETHISWILLTGAYAYKIKKPVALGFLDFSTLERRKFYCHEEVRLNRRLAPELYLGVVAITGTIDTPAVGGDGKAVEFAVQLHQFSQDALLSRVLERRSLTLAHIDALALEIAEFHGRIRIAPVDGPFGSPEHVWKSMADNLEGLDASSSEPIGRLGEWCSREFHVRQEAFIHRKQQGFVRECHGDMHLGNMLLLDGKVVIFDCIEFNETFRWIDVLSELAFTVMDLEDRGGPSFAYRVLNSYLEQTGDYAGLTVFRYYLVYRALVRVKVASIRLRQHTAAPPQDEALVSEYRSYLELTAHYMRSVQPLLIITHGLSGSGKTTVTQPILEALGAVRIRSDIERKRLFGLGPLDNSKINSVENIYADDSTARTYNLLTELAAAVVEAGFSVIVDATCLKREQRGLFLQLAKKLGVPFAILDCRASEQCLAERIQRRLAASNDASEADATVLAQQLKEFEPLDANEQAHAIIIDSEDPRDVETVITRLRRLQGCDLDA
jgi:aminoglycoside phosphotransferase family enzyme/predicted kinase